MDGTGNPCTEGQVSMHSMRTDGGLKLRARGGDRTRSCDPWSPRPARVSARGPGAIRRTTVSGVAERSSQRPGARGTRAEVTRSRERQSRQSFVLDMLSKLDIISSVVAPLNRARQTTAPTDEVASVVEAIVSLFHPHVEAVLHDVQRDRILRIWNPISGRSPGGRSYLAGNLLAEALNSAQIIGPYEQVGTDGRNYVSMTIRLNDGETLLCLNLDRSPLDRAVELLNHFAEATQPRSPALFERDWPQDINDCVADYCRDQRCARDALSREQRLALVALLDRKGFFSVRHATPHVARVLGVSRMTVYTMLKEIRTIALTADATVNTPGSHDRAAS